MKVILKWQWSVNLDVNCVKYKCEERKKKYGKIGIEKKEGDVQQPRRRANKSTAKKTYI